jgi:Tfp pilus assembly protein PilO
MTLEQLTLRLGVQPGGALRKALKEPLTAGIVLTLVIGLAGGLMFHRQVKKLLAAEQDAASARTLAVQKEANLVPLREQAKKINSRLQRKMLQGGQLTANERKMSAVLEKMALTAAGKRVEMVSFRPESVTEGEKDNLLTVRVKVKTDFNELKEYISRLTRFPSPVRIDSVRIETLENETPLVYGDLLAVTRVMKDHEEN